MTVKSGEAQSSCMLEGSACQKDRPRCNHLLWSMFGRGSLALHKCLHKGALEAEGATVGKAQAMVGLLAAVVAAEVGM